MLSGQSRSSTRQLARDVRPDEPLSSFVFREEHVQKASNTSHHKRLTPVRKGKHERLEVSLCRSGGLTDSETWDICAEHFDRFSPKAAFGRCVGPASAVFSAGLVLDADGTPYAEHANIVGWFDAADTPDSELKHFWMAQARLMAPQFVFTPRH